MNGLRLCVKNQWSSILIQDDRGNITRLPPKWLPAISSGDQGGYHNVAHLQDELTRRWGRAAHVEEVRKVKNGVLIVYKGTGHDGLKRQLVTLEVPR